MTVDVSPDRTKNYFRQVKGSVIFKALAVGASFFAIPLMIQYLGNEQYGVWSTLLSIMSWAVFFDFGIGNGLRNKLAESLAKNELAEAAGYISSGYTWIGVTSVVLLFFVVISSFIVPWQVVFNTNRLNNEMLQYAVIVSAIFVFMNFWLGLINQVLNAVQKTSWVVFGQFLSNGLGLIVVIILSKTTEASLLLLVVGYGLSIVVASLLLSIAFYTIRGDLRPRLSYDRKHLYPLLSLGGQFFVIQLAALVIFTTDKILITQLFGPQYVAQYDVVFKLFSVITLLHGLITAPLWSAYTDAYHKSDFIWIGVTIRKQLLIFVCVVVAAIVLCFVAGPIVRIWIGPGVETPLLLILSVSIFMVVSVWNNIFAYFLNGVGEIRLQLYTAVAAMLINIPVAIVLVNNFGFGVDGVVWATCLSLSIFAIVGPIQVTSILAREKSRLAI